MKAVALSELKKELKQLNENELLELCIQLAKYKKENKELLTYLVFNSSNEQQFIIDCKFEASELFKEVNYSNSFFAKKTIRKILRLIKKNAKFSGIKETEIELLIYFCNTLKAGPARITSQPVLQNIYLNQVKRIHKLMEGLHEDIQFDFQEAVDKL